MVGQLDTVTVDDNFTAGVFRHASGGPDGVIKRVERDEDALDALDRYGPVVSIVDNVNVTVSHARAVPIHCPLQTPAQTVRDTVSACSRSDAVPPRPDPQRSRLALRGEVGRVRALVSIVDGLRVRSRRGWAMTPLLPELRSLSAGLVLDGGLVVFDSGVPHFPRLTRRLLHGDRSIAVTLVASDVLRADGHDLMRSAHHARRAVLE